MWKWSAIVLGTLGLVLAIASVYVPQLIERGMNVNVPHQPWLVSPEAAALHETLFVADLHSDTLLWKRSMLSRSSVGHVDLPRLQAGNVALQVFSAVTKSPAGQNYEENTADSDNITALAIVQMWPIAAWHSIYARASYQLDKLYRIAAESDGQLTVIRSKQDLEDLMAQRTAGQHVVGGIYLIEGAHPLEGKLENLDKLYAKGLRISGLTHFFDNAVGGSLHGVGKQGLTPFGRAVIERANQLGVIIDVAHASPAMVEEVLALSSRPVILSHGGMKGVCDSPRNLDDALMRKIAARGGLVGIGYWEGAVCDVTPGGVAKTIRYAIDQLGVEHVALGSDYDGTTAVMFDTSELAILTQTMLEQGFSEQEVRQVMGENAKRFLLENLPDA